MAKDQERAIAHNLYVEQGKTAKEISALLHVSEKTISAWVNANDEAWKKERNARTTSPLKRIENIREIIGNLADRRINLGKELITLEKDGDNEAIEAKRKEISQIDDAVSKWNKTLKDLDKENRVSLAGHLKIMDEIFDTMRHFDEKLYYNTIKFQEHYLVVISSKLL